LFSPFSISLVGDSEVATSSLDRHSFSNPLFDLFPHERFEFLADLSFAHIEIISQNLQKVAIFRKKVYDVAMKQGDTNARTTF
jgi:hypothetical protein